jgi:predicted histone-like DNA-binding protein
LPEKFSTFTAKFSTFKNNDHYMANLKVKKVQVINPATKVKGFTARVICNGTKAFADIVEGATHNTTIHKAEITAACMLFVEGIAQYIKQGYIVDLGDIGKLYPSAKAKWHEKEDEVTMDDVKPHVYFAPSDDIESAIKGAKLSWVTKKDEEAEKEKQEQAETDDPAPEPTTGGDGDDDL